MRRIAGIVVTTLLGCLAVTAIACWRWGGIAWEQGRGLHLHRVFLHEQLRSAPRDGRPLLVWMGDSTILGLGGGSYPQRLREPLAAAGLQSHVVAYLNLDFFNYYCLLDPVLALRPRTIVFLAHWRAFDPDRFRQGLGHNPFVDLVSWLSPATWPAVTQLPLGERVSLPKLVMSPLLRVAGIEDAYYVAQGFRRLVQDLDPTHPPFEWGSFTRAAEAGNVAGYAVPITADTPGVRMLAATVERAVGHGVRAVVLATPIPIDALTERGRFDAARIAAGIDVLRAAAETAGGTFVDLHAALGATDFSDVSGHYSLAGIERLTTLVRPIVGAGP